MGSKYFKFNNITSLLERGAWIFWATLFISLAVGLGQDEVVYTTRDHLEISQLSIYIVVVLLWVSVILQSVRQAFYIHTHYLFNRISNWFLLGASLIFTFRLTFILVFINNYTMHMSSVVLIGVILLSIGLIFNALSDIKNPKDGINVEQS